MPRGTTLIELLLTLALIAILSVLALPTVGALRNRLVVDEAAHAIVAAHARAQLLAVTERRVMLLSLTADSLVLRARESPRDTVPRWRRTGPAADGIAVTGFPHGISFAPSGIPFGFANNSYTLARGAARRQVVVSRYGRVQLR